MSNNRNRHRGKSRTIATAGDAFQFTHKGQVYRLPSAKPAVEAMTAGDLIDAVMDESDAGQLKLALSTLVKADPEPKTMEALRAMSVPDFSNVIMKWFKSGRVDPGKSDSSSD